jgi:multidrug efflux pump
MTTQNNRPNLMDIFIKRPVLAVVISLALTVVGLYAVHVLPVLQFPRIESSSLVISTPYVGASAERVQGFVTDPIEQVAASVPGIDYIDSNTLAGMSTVTVWLKLNENSTLALAELTARLQKIRFELPAGAEDPAIEVRRADKQGAGFYLDVLLNGNMTRAEVTDYLTRHVNPRLAAISGVQRIGIEGGRLPAMRLWLDMTRMAAFRVSSDDIERALRANNLIATIGRSENHQQRVDLLANTTLRTVDDFEKLVISNTDGAQIHISDVARVEMGEVEGDINARLDNQHAVYISVWPLPGANEIAIANALYKQLDVINPTLPDGMHIGIGYDITLYMRSALREIFSTLAETILLVGLVVLALMGSVRTALVPLVTIPVSLLGATAAMMLMGFSLNLLTVLAIVLSVGLVVDDAIVVVENVARHMREGKSRIEAALASSRQLLAPIIGMTITLAAVYAPIGFLSGLTGVLFKEFAFTLAIAVLISGVVALTLSPIMSAYACPEGGHENRATQMINIWFARLQQRYANALARSLMWKPQLLFFAVFFSLLLVPFYFLSQKELAPVEDQSSINVVIEAPPEASLAYTTGNMHEIVGILNALPGARFMWQIVTPQGGFGGQTFTEFHQRKQRVQDLLQRAFMDLGKITGLKAFPILYPALPTAGNFDVEMVVLSSASPQDMKKYADQLVVEATNSKKFLYASTSLKIDLPQVQFNLDRQRIADLGMDLEGVSHQLGVLLSGNYVNRFDLDGKAYQVIPMLENKGRPDADALMDLQLRTPRGEWVPVSAVATLERLTAPRVLGKFQQKNAFRVFGGVIPGTTKEQALAALEQAATRMLPPDYTIDYAGESRQLRQEGNTLLGVLMVALLFVFLVLAVQFNSFRDPLVVLLGSVPLALSGAMLFTFLGWTTINIFSQVGFVTLVGLIAKNGILIVEFANHLQTEGASKLQAIQEAAATRLRPVLMTAGATVLGHFPLVLVTGAGAEARNSIGIILVAGMLIGTFFTLFVLPLVYLLLASTHRPVQEQ